MPVLPLDDTDRALHLLLGTFPTLRISAAAPVVVGIGYANGEDYDAAARTRDYTPSPDAILQAVQALARIAIVLDDLPLKPRLAFMLHYVDGASQADIAARLGVSTRMVHKYLVQALLRCDATCR